MNELTMQHVRESKIIAIVRGQAPEKMFSLAKALLEGGIDMMEITFNQSDAQSWQGTAAAIRSIHDGLPEMYIGAGTVLTTLQLAIAREAGAQFIVTPNTDRPIIHAIKALGLLAFPGAMTPTEAQRAHAAGADAVKIFPAGTLGPAYLKAIASPHSHIPFLAVGGVNDTNIAEFLRAGAIGAGVGGNLVNREWIEREEWGKCTALARAYVQAARG